MRSILRTGIGVVFVLLLAAPASAGEPRFELQRYLEPLLAAWDMVVAEALGDRADRWPESLEKAGPIVDPIGGTGAASTETSADDATEMPGAAEPVKISGRS